MANKSSAFRMNFDSTSDNTEADFGSLKLFLHDIKPFLFQIIAFTAVSALFAFTFVRIPRILGDVIDIFISVIISSILKGKNDFNSEQLASSIVTVVIFFAFNTVFAILQGIISTNISSSYSDRMRKRVFEKTGCASASCFDILSKDRVMQISTECIDTVCQSLNLFLSQILSPFILIIAIVITFFTIEPVISIFVCAFIIAECVLSYILNLLQNHFCRNGHERLCSTDIRELYLNLSTIRLSGKSDELAENIITDEAHSAALSQKSRFFSAAGKALPNLITGLLLVSMILVEYQRTSSGYISNGTFISLAIYILKLSKPLSGISSFSQTKNLLLSNSDALQGYLSLNEEFNKKELEIPYNNEIDISGIDFNYFSNNKNVFENFSSKISSKGITIVYGETGNGKTTLMKLILGLYRPSNGKITYGGADISRLDLEELRNRFFVISQEGTLFEKSLRENIAYPDETIDEERLLNAEKLSGASDFISQYEEKENTVFKSKPQNLSDGQVQLILLARALYHDKKYIILDEATSFVDIESERKIYENLREIAKNRGIIIITHRKTNITPEDNIIEI